MEFKSAYSVPFRGSDIQCEDPSLAQQHFKDDADINVLLERFKVTGQLPQGVVLPSYGDFSGVADYRTARDIIRKADDAFYQLPAQVRSRFGNDPQQLLEFVSNPDNYDESVKLGLSVPDKPALVPKEPKPE